MKVLYKLENLSLLPRIWGCPVVLQDTPMNVARKRLLLKRHKDMPTPT
jgi:hypothetical protein